jgi:hypothetical protein
MLWKFYIDIEIWYQNRNSDVGVEILIPKSISESEFLCRNRNSNFDIKTEIEIPENRTIEISTQLG